MLNANFPLGTIVKNAMLFTDNQLRLTGPINLTLRLLPQLMYRCRLGGKATQGLYMF